MATTSPKRSAPAAIPFWRDVRVLGVIIQVAFVAVVIFGFGWLIGNFIDNAERQDLELGFGFLESTAAFDIGEGIAYEATDTFGRALWVGLVNTIWVSFLGIILTTIVGVVTGIARLSNNWLLSKVAEVYIEIIRNIPLLVLLYFLYFAVILKLPAIRDSIQPFGLPIFLSQRGLAMPTLTATSGFPLWLAFVVLGVLVAMVVWIIQTRQEDQTGEPVNKFGTASIIFLIVAALGWFVVSGFNNNLGVMAAADLQFEEFSDLDSIYLNQLDEDALREAGLDRETINRLEKPYNVADLKAEYEAQVIALEEQIAALPEDSSELEPLQAELDLAETRFDILDDPEIGVCGVEDSTSLIYASNRLQSRGINPDLEAEDTATEAAEAYAQGDCEILVGTQAELASGRAILPTPTDHNITPVSVPPMIGNVPSPTGFNIQGGLTLSPEFFALLAGLTIYTGAFAAEIVRAGILAVSKGQSEAARALGLSDGQRLRLIVLPQAMRVIIPPMTSQYLNLTKNSSLGVAVAFPELVNVGNTVMNQSGLAVQVVIIFMSSYLVLSLTISAFLNWYNKRVALVER